MHGVTMKFILRLLYVKVQFNPHREHHVPMISSVRHQLLYLCTR